MPRTPRIVEPGGIYHITSRGNDGRWIFFENSDREQFLLRLERIVARYGWVVFAYCLMDNHIHLLVQVPEDGLPLECGIFSVAMHVGGIASTAIVDTSLERGSTTTG